MTTITDNDKESEIEYKRKARVQRKQVNSLLSFYTETLTKEFGNMLLSQAVQLLIERRLEQIQAQKQRSEPQTVLWKMPVKVLFDRYKFDVVLNQEKTNESFLIID